MKSSRLAFTRLFAATCSLWMATSLPAADPKLVIRSDYPGGNVLVNGIDGLTAEVAPDLRTTRTDWFYWDFVAEAAEPGRARFVFKGARIGNRGPAVSLDDGRTWKWLGKENVSYSKGRENPEEYFEFDFTEAGQRVRFAVGFPYVQSNLEEFLKKNAGNSNLTTSILTKSTKGRPVELLQIGQPGPEVTSVLVVARSHACEALASYVLEGFLAEALSDSPAGVEFRKKYVLYAVPFLDKDGVEEGDQGKNRLPHDHNRDYGNTNIYPEIKAVQELAAAKNVRIGIDFHCPALRGDIHDAYHWLGLKVPHVDNNAKELSAWLAEERPLSNNTAIAVLKAPPETPPTKNMPFSWYFSLQPNSLLGITLESPYAQAENEDAARAYGRGLLRALVRTEWIEPNGERGAGAYARFAEFGKTMSSLAGRPEEALAAANVYLQNPEAPSVYKAQANLGMVTVELRRKRYPAALEFARAAAAEPGATANQKSVAQAAIVDILSRDPETTAEAIEAAITDLETLPTVAPLHKGTAYRQAAAFFAKKNEHEKALAYSEKQRKFCPDWEKGAALLHEAEILERMNRKEDANERLKEIIAFLKPILLPAPKGKSIQLGTMTGQYFDAVIALPTSTPEEKQEAAQVVLNFPTLPQGLKPRVEKWVAENK
jgi:tetratricopeptide (TPR) repeat protein